MMLTDLRKKTTWFLSFTCETLCCLLYCSSTVNTLLLITVKKSGLSEVSHEEEVGLTKKYSIWVINDVKKINKRKS